MKKIAIVVIGLVLLELSLLGLRHQVFSESATNETQAEAIVQISPSIYEIVVVQNNPVRTQLHITGANFSSEATVHIEGIQQGAVHIQDMSSIYVSVNTASLLPVSDDFSGYSSVMVQNPGGGEFAFAVELPRLLDATETLSLSADWVADGANLIAHAFGGWEGLIYTSGLESFLESFLESYANGIRLFEWDSQFTSDGVLIGKHDSMRTPLATFEQEQQAVPYTLISFSQVVDLMVDFDDWYLITDTKYHHNFLALYRTFEYMVSEINTVDPALIDRVIVQVYTQQMYHFVVNHFPFTQFIYTLYASPDTNEQVVEFVYQTGMPVVTMWIDRATPEFVAQLNNIGAEVFVHTTEDILLASNLFERGIRGVFTFFITPDMILVGDDLDEQNDLTSQAEQAEQAAHEQMIQARHQYIVDYLASLKQDDLLIILSANDEASAGLSPDILVQLQSLGLVYSLENRWRYSYLGVVSGAGHVFHEALSPGRLTHTMFVDGHLLELTSSGYDAISLSSIRINGVEYSRNGRGLNVVVFNLRTGQVEDSVVFDTFWELEASR